MRLEFAVCLLSPSEVTLAVSASQRRPQRDFSCMQMCCKDLSPTDKRHTMVCRLHSTCAGLEEPDGRFDAMTALLRTTFDMASISCCIHAMTHDAKLSAHRSALHLSNQRSPEVSRG